ncbi:MAG TPA: VC0807 family protein [Candidatus Sulfotelmatobacter sp.]|nr:VC0807 family protein [Candidatus Sulfotelmatobacter sp.]
MENSAPPFSARAAIIDAVLNAAVPTVVYQIAHHRGIDDVHALLLAAIYPAVVAVFGLARRRTLDPVAGIVLFGIVVSLVAFFVGGSPQVLLIRESFVTGALGVLCFVSLLFPKPLMYWFGRWFATHGDAAAARVYDALWERPQVRTANRLLTVVWGVAFCGEFVLRVVFVVTLPIPVVLAVSPIVLAAITIATLTWTFAYVRVLRARAAAAGVVVPG